jgi:hypothetical protein
MQRHTEWRVCSLDKPAMQIILKWYKKFEKQCDSGQPVNHCMNNLDVQNVSPYTHHHDRCTYTNCTVLPASSLTMNYGKCQSHWAAQLHTHIPTVFKLHAYSRIASTSSKLISVAQISREPSFCTTLRLMGWALQYISMTNVICKHVFRLTQSLTQKLHL